MSGDLPIDNLNPNTFFLALTMKTYLGFIYDLQTESGNVGTLLTVDKGNFTITYHNSLFTSYVAATFLKTRDVILAVSTSSSVNIITYPEYSNLTTIDGPFLINSWGTFTDPVLIKSVN